MCQGGALGGVRERAARGTATPHLSPLACRGHFTVGMLSAVEELFPSKLFSMAETKSMHDTTRMMHRRSMILNGRTLEQALDAYTQATHGALRKLGKKPVVWEGATPAWRCRSCTRLARARAPIFFEDAGARACPLPAVSRTPPLSIVANSTGCKLSLWAGWLYCGARWWARAQAPSAWPWLARYTPVCPLPGAHGSHAA